MNVLDENILNVDKGVICQQVNCKGIMGAGLARDIRDKFPKVYEEYRKLCAGATDDFDLLGTIQVVPVGDQLWVINFFSQYDIGSSDKQTEYCAFIKCVKAVREWLSSVGGRLWDGSRTPPVFIPFKVGCGLGGGDWKVVRKILEKHLPDSVIVKKPR